MTSMPRFVAAVAVLAWLFCAPDRSDAQAKDDFVRGLIELTQAVNGVDGRDEAAVRAALDAMAKGLAEWDAAVARVEGGFKGAITGRSLRRRRECAARWPPPIWNAGVRPML
jgi:hypothetical protein